MSATFDIELAITAFDDANVEQLEAVLPDGYVIENQVLRGYGLVVRGPVSNAEGDLEAKVIAFLEPLISLSSSLRDHGCVLRTAIFSDTAINTTNWTRSMLDVLEQFSASIETTTYPTRD